jgi:hypothetical protein
VAQRPGKRTNRGGGGSRNIRRGLAVRAPVIEVMVDAFCGGACGSS